MIRRFAIFLVLLPACWKAAPPSLPGVQGDIDALLGRLLPLMHQRLQLMNDVARNKWSTGKPIEDPERERASLDDLARRGQELGLNEDLVRSFFRAQMEAGKMIQEAHFQSWRAPNQQPIADVPDLATLRNRIDALNGQLLDLLPQVQRLRDQEGWGAALQLQALQQLSGGGISEEIRRTALRPLEETRSPGVLP